MPNATELNPADDLDADRPCRLLFRATLCLPLAILTTPATVVDVQCISPDEKEHDRYPFKLIGSASMIPLLERCKVVLVLKRYASYLYDLPHELVFLLGVMGLLCTACFSLVTIKVDHLDGPRRPPTQRKSFVTL